jgi:hypothetical protein
LSGECFDVKYANRNVRGRVADPRCEDGETMTPSQIVITLHLEEGILRIDSVKYPEFWIEMYFKKGG